MEITLVRKEVRELMIAVWEKHAWHRQQERDSTGEVRKWHGDMADRAWTLHRALREAAELCKDWPMHPGIAAHDDVPYQVREA